MKVVTDHQRPGHEVEDLEKSMNILESALPDTATALKKVLQLHTTDIAK